MLDCDLLAPPRKKWKFTKSTNLIAIYGKMVVKLQLLTKILACNATIKHFQQ